jgi:hypothetical protein
MATSPNGMTSQATTTTQLKGQPQVSLRLLMLGLWFLVGLTLMGWMMHFELI